MHQHLQVNGHGFPMLGQTLKPYGWGLVNSLYGFGFYPIIPLQRVMLENHWMRRFDFDPEAVVRLCWAGVYRSILMHLCVIFVPMRGGVSHFRYLRDNTLLTWMHTDSFSGFVAFAKINFGSARRRNIKYF